MLPVLEAYSLDQLSRILTFSKWMLVVGGVLFFVFLIVNQWVATRISALQDEEKRRADQQLRASRAELAQTKAETNELATKTSELTEELSRFVAPRSLTEDQLDTLQKCLVDGPRGPVVMAILKTEKDADSYAAQIAKLLTDTGFEVTMANTVWLQLPVKGLYLCARDVASAPLHAVHIQRCFQTAGVRVRAHEDKKMYMDMTVPDEAVIFVVGARE